MSPGSEAQGPAGGERRDLLTVALEDYFQVAPLRHLIPPGHWVRFERRVERNTLQALDLLDASGAQATFFVVGWLAQEMPELVALVTARGHEVASKGFFHRSLAQLDPAEFRDDLVRSREVLERTSGRQVAGYRVAHGWFGPGDLWALDEISRAGFVYDSSVRPQLFDFRRQPDWHVARAHQRAGGALWEFPLSSTRVLGLPVPISGGNYHRQFPQTLMRRAIERWHRERSEPFLMYFHVWDLDPEQPRIQGAPWLERVRQYRNLDKMEAQIRAYLQRYRFCSIAQWLGLEPRPAAAPAPPVAEAAWVIDRPASPVSVVVPCFNEALVLRYLRNTLDSVRDRLRAAGYQLRFVFVDDASRDQTWPLLVELFGGRPDCTLVRHQHNRGVAGAILTGLEAARTELVASIDADCTYDPHQLGMLLDRLGPTTAMVTASPYHPDGKVRNVSGARLLLSRGLSQLYRWVLGSDLHTFTSCFRVYRRSQVADLALRHTGFLGVAEFLGQLSLRGARIEECPAVLEARLLGSSKMKVLHTIVGHLGLLVRLIGARWRAKPAAG